MEGSRMFRFHKKLQHCREGVLGWRKKTNTNSRIQIENIKNQMVQMQDKGGQRDWENWNELRGQLAEAYKEEKEFWARKSMVEWL